MQSPVKKIWLSFSTLVFVCMALACLAHFGANIATRGRPQLISAMLNIEPYILLLTPVPWLCWLVFLVTRKVVAPASVRIFHTSILVGIVIIGVIFAIAGLLPFIGTEEGVQDIAK